METITKTTITRDPRRLYAIQALAVVGFITLIIMGIVLAIYTARFVPDAVNRVGSAAVYLSQVFSPSDDENLTVVPQIPFENVVASTTTATTTIPATPVATVIPGGATPAAVNPGPRTTTTYPVGAGSNAPLSGKSDLTVSITQTGYLTSDSTDSFISSKSVPDNKNAAVKFTVTNTGTNTTGAWEFRAELPTTSSYTFNSASQQSLRPGEKIDYVLGFDRARSGDRTITITVDSGSDVNESNEGNNSDSESITIK
ncbi:MAG: hypothetical protein AB203_01585 [Parcubacteria bacterium C7867-008]|nr:MAG: hypothetical protein AB203_01585 [Parcubacteria bacterium C7867-008]